MRQTSSTHRMTVSPDALTVVVLMDWLREIHAPDDAKVRAHTDQGADPREAPLTRIEVES